MKKIVSCASIVFIFASSTLMGCSCNISSTQNSIEQNIENYVSESTDALDSLRQQLKSNLRELKNRTSDIENEEYFTKLKNNLSKVTGNSNIRKTRLLDYNNMFYLASNGIVEKTSELKHLYSLIKSLEDVENSFIINKEK